MRHLGSLQGLTKQITQDSVQQKIFIGMVSKGSRALCLPSPVHTAGHGEEQLWLSNPALSPSHHTQPAFLCQQRPPGQHRPAQEATGNPDTTESIVCRCGLSPKPREAELVLGASGDLVRRGRVHSGSSLNGTHRTAQKVGKHLLSGRSWQVKPGRKEQCRVAVGCQLLSRLLLDLAVVQSWRMASKLAAR